MMYKWDQKHVLNPKFVFKIIVKCYELEHLVISVQLSTVWASKKNE